MPELPSAPSSEDLMAAVAGFYGAAMVQVQAFELVLAGLVFAVELTPPSDPPTDPQASPEKIWRLVHVAAAGRMRDRLKGKVPDGLLTEIKALVSWRNFLAHRYLHSRLRMAAGSPMAASGPDCAELLGLTRAFADGTKRISEATVDIVEAGHPAADVRRYALPPVGHRSSSACAGVSSLDGVSSLRRWLT